MLYSAALMMHQTQKHVVTMLNHEIYTEGMPSTVTSDDMVFLPFHKHLFMYQQVE
jgi:hypothetical protein